MIAQTFHLAVISLSKGVFRREIELFGLQLHVGELQKSAEILHL